MIAPVYLSGGRQGRGLGDCGQGRDDCGTPVVCALVPVFSWALVVGSCIELAIDCRFRTSADITLAARTPPVIFLAAALSLAAGLEGLA